MSHSSKQILTDAKNVIKNIIYITLATANKSGIPWNSPVYSAYDEKYNFFWASWIKNQHSENIKENENVFIVIYDSTAPVGAGFGVYFSGKGRMLEEEDIGEIEKASLLLAKRKNMNARNVREYLGNYPRRIYKFTPERVWVNSDGDINGNFIDTRIDITDRLFSQ